MALGAIAALKELGLNVPQDVSIVGFDDVPEAAYYSPALTTIRQDFSALGEQSVAYLVSLLENPETEIRQRILYPELIIRNSTTALQKD
jgi:DNA-binding LacI/PurR family transcriptional regulator